jgi:antirestriction protein ArdC
LKREGITEHNGMGSESYAKEELIAELGCAFLCAETGIENETIQNTSAYLQHWIKHLKSDNKFLFNAVSQSQKAVTHILGN